MIVLIGDVGTPDGRYHLGDEAMLESALLELRARGRDETTVISADPDSTRERYGVASVGRIGFAGLTLAQREERLEAVVGAARGERGSIEWDDSAWAVIETVAASTGVIVTGGGNLSLLWPEHVYERVALARIAAAMDRPLALSGQMIGPFLDQRTGELVGELLTTATAVGVRDAHSLEIAHRLIGERPVSLLADDALLLALGDPEADPASDGGPVIATFAPYLAGIPIDAFVDGAAATLETLRQLTGSEVRFVPHAGTLARLDDGDSVLHARVAERLGHGALEPLLDASAAAALHRSASFTLSTRYHPIVFASVAGRPMIGAPADDYTATKIRGALAVIGAQQALVPAGSLGGIASLATATSLWAARDRLAAAAAERRPVLVDAHRRWWDALAESFGCGPAIVVPAAAELELIDDSTRTELTRATTVLLNAGSRTTLNEFDTEARELETAATRAELEVTERAVADLRDELARARKNTVELEGALAETHRLLSELADPALQRSLSRNVSRYIPPSTVEAMLETRTFRWARRVRNGWARVRRWTGRA